MSSNFCLALKTPILPGLSLDPPVEDPFMTNVPLKLIRTSQTQPIISTLTLLRSTNYLNLSTGVPHPTGQIHQYPSFTSNQTTCLHGHRQDKPRLHQPHNLPRLVPSLQEHSSPSPHVASPTTIPNVSVMGDTISYHSRAGTN